MYCQWDFFYPETRRTETLLFRSLKKAQQHAPVPKDQYV